MAEVSYFHLHGDEDDEDDVVTLDSVPYWSHDFDTFDVFPSDPQFSPPDLSHTISIRRRNAGHSPGLASDSVTAADLFTRENQVNFVMDLFHQRVEESAIAGEADLVSSDPNFDLNFGVVAANDEMGSSDLELDLGLGLGFCVDRHDDDDSGFMVADCGDEFFVSRREAVSDSGGSSTAGRLREVEIESGSEEGENEHGFDLNVEEDRGLENLCWDSFRLDRRDVDEDFEWEEVDERVNEREVLSMFFDTEVDEDLDASVATVIPSQAELNADGGNTMRNLEWEVLLLNLDANPNAVNNGGEPNLDDDQDEYNYAAEYEMLFGQFAENENALVGRPPASKTFVENLPSIALTQEDVDHDNALCAVCKDEMKVGEEGKELPCLHRYHGECILPWLGIRNTCPVCRYELPTDDPEYERRRNRSAGRVQ